LHTEIATDRAGAVDADLHAVLQKRERGRPQDA
jgi:hypothetical protein